MKAILIACVLAGCSTVFEQLPSMQYCDKVSYVRAGVDVTIKAECRAAAR